MTSKPDPKVAGSVRAEMARANKSQSALAERLHLSQPAVSRRMTGDLPFTIDQLASIAAFLDVPIDTFIPDPEAISA